MYVCIPETENVGFAREWLFQVGIFRKVQATFQPYISGVAMSFESVLIIRLFYFMHSHQNVLL